MHRTLPEGCCRGPSLSGLDNIGHRFVSFDQIATWGHNTFRRYALIGPVFQVVTGAEASKCNNAIVEVMEELVDPSLKEPRNLWLIRAPSKLFSYISSVPCSTIPKPLWGSWSRAETGQGHGENVKTQIQDTLLHTLLQWSAYSSNIENVSVWKHLWSVEHIGLKSYVSGPQWILSLLSYLLETIQSSSAVKQKIAIQSYFSSLSQKYVLPLETPGTGLAVSALWELSWAEPLKLTDVDRAWQHSIL